MVIVCGNSLSDQKTILALWFLLGQVEYLGYLEIEN
jgi:hypothetical protein